MGQGVTCPQQLIKGEKSRFELMVCLNSKFAIFSLYILLKVLFRRLEKGRSKEKKGQKEGVKQVRTNLSFSQRSRSG